MSTAVLDEQKRIQFESFDESIEIKKPDGQVVGMYVPEAEYRKMRYDLAMAACPYTEEEMLGFENETGGSTLADLWKRLGVKQ